MEGGSCGRSREVGEGAGVVTCAQARPAWQKLQSGNGNTGASNLLSSTSSPPWTGRPEFLLAESSVLEQLEEFCAAEFHSWASPASWWPQRDHRASLVPRHVAPVNTADVPVLLLSYSPADTLFVCGLPSPGHSEWFLSPTSDDKFPLGLSSS